MPRLPENRQGVGQVVLALIVVRAQFFQRRQQRLDPVAVDAGVDFPDGAFRLAGVAMLADGGQIARFVPEDAPVAAGIVQYGAEHRRRGFLAPVQRQQVFERLRTDERHVAREHEHVARQFYELRPGHLNRVPRAVLRFLDDETHVGAVRAARR